MSTTVAGHGFVPAHERPSVFVRVAAWIRDRWDGMWAGVRMALAATEPEAETYENGAGFPESAPTQVLPRVEVPALERPEPGHPVFPEGQRVHPPFAQPQAYCQHVLDRMQHLLIDQRRNPAMTAAAAESALRPLMTELWKMAQQEQAQARRMERNQRTAAAQAAVLEDAVLRGEGDAAAAQAADAMASRARYTISPEDTQIGAIPRITEDMPDPREVEAVPVEAAPEPAVEIEPAEPWTSEELSELGALDGEQDAEVSV